MRPARRRNHFGSLRSAYTATPVVVMGDRSGSARAPEFNEIDKLVDEKLKQVKILPSDLCTDASSFAGSTRSCGLPPLREMCFLDGRPTRVKRDALVDKLSAVGICRSLGEQVPISCR